MTIEERAVIEEARKFMQSWDAVQLRESVRAMERSEKAKELQRECQADIIGLIEEYRQEVDADYFEDKLDALYTKYSLTQGNAT